MRRDLNILLIILTFFNGILTIYAQDRVDSTKVITVKGTVLNEKGQRIKGASVILYKSSSDDLDWQEETYMQTNMAGKYSIKATLKDSLGFSKNGYWSKSVPVSTAGSLDIVLIEEMSERYIINGIIQDESGNSIEGVSIGCRYQKPLGNGQFEEVTSFFSYSLSGGHFGTYQPKEVMIILKKDGYETVEVLVSDLINRNDVKVVLKKINIRYP